MSYEIVILLSYYLHNSIQEQTNYTRKQGHATHNLYDFLHGVVVDRKIATQKCPHHNHQNLWIFTLHGKRGSECVIKGPDRGDYIEFTRLSLMWVLKAGEIEVSESGFEEGGKGHETRDVCGL